MVGEVGLASELDGVGERDGVGASRLGGDGIFDHVGEVDHSELILVAGKEIRLLCVARGTMEKQEKEEGGNGEDVPGVVVFASVKEPAGVDHGGRSVEGAVDVDEGVVVLFHQGEDLGSP